MVVVSLCGSCKSVLVVSLCVVVVSLCVVFVSLCVSCECVFRGAEQVSL